MTGLQPELAGWDERWMGEPANGLLCGCQRAGRLMLSMLRAFTACGVACGAHVVTLSCIGATGEQPYVYSPVCVW